MLKISLLMAVRFISEETNVYRVYVSEAEVQ